MMMQVRAPTGVLPEAPIGALANSLNGAISCAVAATLASANETAFPLRRESLAHDAARLLGQRYRLMVNPIRLGVFWLALTPGHGDASAVAPLFTDWSIKDWQALVVEAQKETMLTWISHRLSKDSLGCPSTVLETVASQVAQRRLWNRYLGLAALHLCEQLAKQGLHIRILKGAPLSALLYGDMSHRDVRDIDLLVSESQLLETARALEAMGFKCQVDLHWFSTPHFRRNLREVSFHKLNGAIEIDLHWRINNGWVGEKLSIDNNENGPTTQIPMGNKVVRWFSINHALALSDANIINAHRVEMKASVDRLRLAAFIANNADALNASPQNTPPLTFANAQSVIDATAAAIEIMAKIAHLSPAETASDLFGDVAAAKQNPGFLQTWARHLRRTRSFSQCIALLSAAVSPALADYMRAEDYSARKLFVRAMRRKLFG